MAINPAPDILSTIRELCDRSFRFFFTSFWPIICHDPLKDNWHIEYLCNELQAMAERVARREANPWDLIINVPPGTSKTTICCIMFPVWCWTRWPWMRFLTFSYNKEVSLEPAHGSKTVLESRLFKAVYPDITISEDRSGVTNFRISYVENGIRKLGGGRLSSSVGGTGTGFHADILIVDDPLNPKQAAADSADLKNANDFVEQTLPTRKTIKEVSPTVLIMQRLHENDPSGFLLSKKLSIKHICLPADISDEGYAKLVSPPELKAMYTDGLLDPARLDRATIEDLEERLGQYGAAAQLGQNPSPPSGGMFKTDRFIIVDQMPPEVSIVRTIRYWDKAGTDPTKEKGGSKEPAYTVGTKMLLLASGKYLVTDVKRKRLAAEDREDLILATAQADGQDVEVWTEQEPGSGGKESAEATVRNLAGFKVHAERPVGNKVARADTFSVQVNRYNVMLLRGDWNAEWLREYGFFPNSRFKDQVDSGSGAFNRLAQRKQVWVGRRRSG